MILSCPVYVYGLFLVQKPSTRDLWPPIVLNSVYLMLTPQFFKSTSLIHRCGDRAGMVIGVIIASAGITINGLILSSSDPSYLIGAMFYGGLGGKHTVKLYSYFFRLVIKQIKKTFLKHQYLCPFIN